MSFVENWDDAPLGGDEKESISPSTLLCIPIYIPEIPQSGMPSAHEVHHYLGRNDDREGAQVVDTQSIGLADDRELARAGGGGGIHALPVRDPLPSARGPELAPNGRRRPRETLPLPPGASNTLYIKGLPSDSSRREVARYKMDEHDHDSAYLRLQFSKFPGPRFGGSGSTRGKR
ncbi:hypothetical protein KY290_007657 [Solanum tuberosum]|uniref:Uncharacterized protein n=1 Tax=Solanum tuberosum TaxID=4113 RepID=A0ABQ7W669_SOLTU|nr:hypothetical protein KY290_007657 [Solanum tuberosum]